MWLSDSTVTCSIYVPARWVLALWSFLGFINLFTLRMDINIAILAMVNATNSSDQGGLTQQPSDPPQVTGGDNRFKYKLRENSAALKLTPFRHTLVNKITCINKVGVKKYRGIEVGVGRIARSRS